MAGLAQIRGVPYREEDLDAPAGAAGNPIDLDAAPPPAPGRFAPGEDPDDPNTWRGVKPVKEGDTLASMSNSSAPSDPSKRDPAIIIGAGLGAMNRGGGNPLAPPGQAAGQAASEDAESAQQQQQQPMATYAPSYTVPAHWQPGSHAWSTQYGMDPGELEPGAVARESAAGHDVYAAGQRAEAEKRRAFGDATYAAAHQYATQEANKRIALINAEKEKYVADQQSKLKQLAAQTQAEVDPEAIWKERGSFAKVLAGIGVALGQFGALMRGGTNNAYEIVKGQIDANIAAQRENIANARHAFDTQSNLYAQNLQAFGDREKAAIATKINYLDQVSAIVDQQRALSKSQDADARAAEIQAQIMKDQAQAYDQFAVRTHTQLTEQENETYRPAQTAAAGLKRPENLITLSDGTTVQMPNAPEHGEAVKKIAVLDELQRRNNEILALRQKAAGLDPLLDRTEYQKAMAQLKDLGQQKISLMSLAVGQGVVKEAEYARAKEEQSFAEEGLGFFKGNPLASSAREVADEAIRAQTERWNKDQHSYVRAAGVPIVKKGYVQDARGNLVPAGKYTGQDADRPSNLAPPGSRSLDPSVNLRTEQRPAAETTPQAPRFDVQQAARDVLAKQKGGEKSVKAPPMRKIK